MYGKTKIGFTAWCANSVVAVLLLGCSENMNDNTENMAPVAEKVRKELTIHGHTRVDNYYWLNQREDQKVIEYLNAENEYTSNQLKHTEELQTKIFDEIVGRIKHTDMSVPYKEGAYYYFSRFVEDKEYPITSREIAVEGRDMVLEILKDVDKGSARPNEEVLLDVNHMAEGFDFYDVSGIETSPDDNILAYGVDTVSRREYTIYFKNLSSGELYEESIPRTTGGVTWANDNKTVFYTVKDETLRSFKIFRHVLGTSTEEDVEVYHESDEIYNTFIYKTKSKKYLVIGSYATLSSEYRILEADDPNGEFRVFHPRQKEMEYSIDHYEDKFYIKTNDEALNFRLMVTDVGSTRKENWTTQKIWKQ